MVTNFVPPSAWGMTPAQRIARLRVFIKINKGRRGRAQEQRERYFNEIAQIEQKENQNNDKSTIH